MIFSVEKLEHNDSFCEDKMALGYEISELGWDLSIKASYFHELYFADTTH